MSAVWVRLLVPAVVALLAACGDGGAAGAPAPSDHGPTSTDPAVPSTTQPGLADPDPLVGILEELTDEVRAALAEDPHAAAARAEGELQSLLLELMDRPGDPDLLAIFDALRVDVPPIPEALGPISRNANDVTDANYVREPGEPQGLRRGSVPAALNPLSQAATGGSAAVLAAFGDLVKSSADGRLGEWSGAAPGETGHVSVGRVSGRRKIADSAAVGDGGILSASAVGDVDVELCPDPSGLIHGRFEYDASAQLTVGDSGLSGAYHLVTKWESEVGDDATLQRTDFTFVVAMSTAAHGSRDGRPTREGVFFELEVIGSMDRADPSTVRFTGGRVLRASRGAGEEFVGPVAHAGGAAAVVLIELIMKTAERYWRDGACVEVRLTPSSGPDGLDSGQEVTVSVDPRAEIDDLPTGGKTTLRLISGGASVTPSDSPLETPVDVIYVAPRHGEGWVDARSVSRRGIGVGDIEFSVGHGYIVDASDGVFNIRAVKCGGPSGDWHFDLSANFDGGTFTGTVTADLRRPSLSGPFTLSGTTSGGGISLAQSGTGTLTFAEDGDGGAVLIIKGDAWAAGAWSGGGRDPGSIPLQPAPPGTC